MLTTMQLYCTITADSGRRVPLVLDETVLTSMQLRQRVSEATKIPLKDLRLIFRGRMIKDNDSVASVIDEYKLENDSVLHCMGKPVKDTNNNNDSSSNSSSNHQSTAAATATDTTTVPNRTVVPPLSTSTTASASASASASGQFATASATASAGGSDPLSRALARLKQNNPPSVYVTAVGTLEKVLTNITSNALDEKYRRVKRNNATFGKRLGKLVGGHDCMLACGFVVEHQSSEEVYQLHASAEKWSGLLHTKTRIAEASATAKQEQEQSRQRPTTGFGGVPSPSAGMAGMGAGGMGGFPPPNMNDPNMQNMMSQVMNNPEALGQALQNPMIQQMMRNDPNASPMMRQYMETMANNPAMLQQMTQRMQDPAVRAQLQRAMQSGTMPGMGGMGGMPGAGAGTAPTANAENATAPPPQPQNDQGQTEAEMIAEAIRRSLEDN